MEIGRRWGGKGRAGSTPVREGKERRKEIRINNPPRPLEAFGRPVCGRCGVSGRVQFQPPSSCPPQIIPAGKPARSFSPPKAIVLCSSSSARLSALSQLAVNAAPGAPTAAAMHSRCASHGRVPLQQRHYLACVPDGGVLRRATSSSNVVRLQINVKGHVSRAKRARRGVAAARRF